MTTKTITLSYNPESGEGYLSSLNQEKLDNFTSEHGWLFAADVLGDWKDQIDFAHSVAMMGADAEWLKHSNTTLTAEEVAIRIARHGGNPGVYDCFVEYADCGLIDYDLAHDVEEVSSEHINNALSAEARREATSIVDMILSGQSTSVDDATDYNDKVHLAVAEILVSRLTESKAA